MQILKSIRVGLLAVLVSLTSLLSPAFAQDANTRVIVPDVPGGAVFSGCYKVSTSIYGGYRLNFCLKQRGTYTVTGQGVKCNGTLSWSVARSDINVHLRRTSCGNGVAWSADRMTCRGAGLLRGLIPFVIIPNVPNLAALRCTYTPSAPGYKPITFLARRIS
jgi:hypothetical protein